jgi:(E)-4-hydroxy-3-methylbut-2-enyl-diphosphate synthase
MANMGVSLPGNNERPSCPIYIDGKHTTNIKGTIEEIKPQWFSMIESYLKTRFSDK